MRAFFMLGLVVAFMAGQAMAQNADARLETDTPYHRYEVSIPDAVLRNEVPEPLHLSIVAAANGDFIVSAATLGFDICAPICWMEGAPPRRICRIFGGCPHTPGGGGTLQAPLTVEFVPPDLPAPMSEETDLTLKIVRDAPQADPRLELEVVLPLPRR
jgi:hypothetical protein